MYKFFFLVEIKDFDFYFLFLNLRFKKNNFLVKMLIGLL